MEGYKDIFATASIEAYRQNAERMASRSPAQRAIDEEKAKQTDWSRRQAMAPSQENQQMDAYHRRFDPFNSQMERDNRDRAQSRAEFIAKAPQLELDAARRKAEMDAAKRDIRSGTDGHMKVTFENPGTADRVNGMTPTTRNASKPRSGSATTRNSGMLTNRR